MSILKDGATYRFENRADGSRSLNVYGTSPVSLANVCLWGSSSDDICQQWVYEASANGNRGYLRCKDASGLYLDVYTGSGAANVVGYNAHVYAISNTAYLEIEEIAGGYIRIKSMYNGRYLTANQGSGGTSGGKDVNAAGNVYFYDGGLTDRSQDWLPVRMDADPTPDPKPEPSDGQNLIFPVNNARITAGYKVSKYETLGYGRHYGTDYVDADHIGEIGNRNIIASGLGKIYRSGWDRNVGYFACIVYPDALIMENGRRTKKDVAVRYWHMKSLDIPTVTDTTNPVEISKNEVIGTMGQEGKVANGIHLHVECDTDVTPEYTYWTPTHFASPHIFQNGTDTTISPGAVFQVGSNQRVGINSEYLGSWVLEDDYQYIGKYYTF